MKTIAFYLLLLMVAIPSRAQNKAVDDIFNKFSGKDGVTTVSVDKNMMDLFAQMDSADFKAKELFAQISNIKVLAFEKAVSSDIAAFQDMVKALPLNDYKELLVVKDKDQNVKMLMKQNNDRISEFLLLVTGGNEPVMVSITGNMDPKDLGKLTSVMKMDGLQHLAKLNQKK